MMNDPDILHLSLDSHIQSLESTVLQSASVIAVLTRLLCEQFRSGHKLMLCGNGGSAADAQHIAGEFVNHFRFNRSALPALALTTDSSILTCIGNDISFDDVFSRQVEALGKPGDILVALSTSGRSPNILKALDTAHSIGVTTVGFTGLDGREKMMPKCDYCLIVPSKDTPRIQECHEFIFHVICEVVELKLFPSRKEAKSEE